MLKIFLNMMAGLTGNALSQRFLGGMVQGLLYLMGIGAGGAVGTSGEGAVLRLLKGRCRQGCCVFDVGANKGQFLELLSQIVPGSAEIHCFEPGSAAFAELTAAAEGKANVTVNNVALGSQAGTANLFLDTAGSALASLTPRRLDHFGIALSQKEAVKVETLDHYCRARGINAITLLKLDVEGHELEVLKGAGEMFRRRAIGMVLFEFGGCNIDTRTFVQDYYYFFQTNGMKLWRLTPSGYLSPLAGYTELAEQFVTTMFLACRPEIQVTGG